MVMMGWHYLHDIGGGAIDLAVYRRLQFSTILTTIGVRDKFVTLILPLELYGRHFIYFHAHLNLYIFVICTKSDHLHEER